MRIELDKPDRQQAIESIQRYFTENMEAPIGNITACALLNFFLEEIGPCIYNKAVADARARMQARLDDLEFDVQEDVFTYWRKFDKARGKKGQGLAGRTTTTSVGPRFAELHDPNRGSVLPGRAPRWASFHSAQPTGLKR